MRTVEEIVSKLEDRIVVVFDTAVLVSPTP